MSAALEIGKVTSTVHRLEQRITERFPGSGLQGVAGDLGQLSEDFTERTRYIAAPHHVLRLLAAIIILTALLVLGYGISEVEVRQTRFGIPDLIQVAEALLNTLVLIGAAVFFLVTIESRIKRQRALVALHQLRSIAHIIDMHQLTKDPVQLTGTESRTASSPERSMTTFEIQRYLDYCSELLSLTGKLAGVLSQSTNDGAVITSAAEVEQLTIGQVLLLCTDGLFSCVPEVEIQQTIADNAANLDEAAAALIESALAHGAPDNVTVVLAQLVVREEKGKDRACNGRRL